MAAANITPRALPVPWLLRVTRYDPETGTLFWREQIRRAPAGDPMTVERVKAHLRVEILGRRIYVHRLAWLHMTGEWPAGPLDHINGIGSDNRWVNLRAATHQLNMENRRGAQKNNVSGFLGVSQSPHSGLFFARVQHNGKTVRTADFDDAQDAHHAYLALKRKLHAGCTI